jgi:membrane associated rhomboid family serine protease
MLPVRDHLPTRITPWVNYALIAANVAVFALEASGIDIGRWVLVPAHLRSDPLSAAPTLLTHQFLHASIAHVGGNMLFLWIFGDNVEDVLGHARYALFYGLCGVCAALAQFAANPSLDEPMLGASGAIAGVLAAYAVLYPRSRITVVNPIPVLWLFWGLFIMFPAWLVILEFFAVNLWHAFDSSGQASGVAFVAHVGGFIAGLALLPVLRVNEKVDYDPWERWRRGDDESRWARRR